MAKRVPQGVLCLISALSFHELTTQVPHAIDVALERGTRKPRLDYPPTKFFWFSGPALHEGIETRSWYSTAMTTVWIARRRTIRCNPPGNSAR